jgi:Ca-activated chloride channel family protein
VPVDDPVFGRRYVTIDASVDEETLEQIAGITGGRYFRATSAEALERIYGEIDRMEKSEAETTQYVEYTEQGPRLALVAGLVLALGLGLGESLGNRIP